MLYVSDINLDLYTKAYKDEGSAGKWGSRYKIIA